MENQNVEEIQRVIHALLEADTEKEKDEQVKSQIETTVFQIGTKRHAVVIPALLTFLKQPNVARNQKLLILNSLSVIVDNDTILSAMHDEVAHQLIQAAVDSQSDKDTLEIGSDLLVTLSRKYCIEVMKQMLHLFQPGHLPAASTFKTFGRIFSANVYDSIPFLSAVLSMLVPLLPEAKTDAIKRAIAGAVSQFAEAIVEYVANETEAPDPGVKISFYQNEFNAVFEYILVHWLPKTREAEHAAYMLNATSCLARVASKEKLQEMGDRLLSSAVSILRRFPHEPDASEGLSLTLENLANKSKSTLENQLDILMDVIFIQVCAPPDYAKQFGVKAHNELLRGFTILYLNFPDKVITFLLNKLNVSLLKSTVNKDATDRTLVGALTIVNKLVNQADVSFSFYLSPLLKTLEPIVSATPAVPLSNNVKQSLAHLVLTLADRLYLAQENSTSLIEFVVRQCAVPATAIPRSPAGLETITDESLRASCENVLHLLTTTVHGMEKILLPSLFDFLLAPQYTESVKTLTRCLLHLQTKQDIFASLKSADGRTHPTSTELFTRLFVLSGFVGEFTDEESLLRLLQLSAVHVSDAIKELWEGTTAELEKFMQTSSDQNRSWDSKAWEEVLLKLLETSLKDLRNVEPETVNNITDSFSRQISLYADYPAEKCFLYLALGVTLEVTVDPLLVNRAIDSMFLSVNHSRISERQACASSFGRASSTHFDLIISKLDAYSVPTAGKKSSLFNIFSHKEKTTDIEEKMKPTIVLCYAHAVCGSPRALLLTRIDEVMRSVLPYFVGAKDFAVKHALCRFTELLAKSLKETNSTLEKRQTLMFHMKDFVKTESAELRSSVRALAISACSELAVLPPRIPVEELEDALLLFCNGFFPLLPPRHDPGQVDSVSLETGSSVYLNYEIFWEATFKSLKLFMIVIVTIYRTSDSVLTLIKNLKPWLESDSDNERYHSLVMLHDILKSEAMSDSVVLPTFGTLSGLLATRSMDPDARCRETALSCGSLLENISNKDANGIDWATTSKSCFLKECLSSSAYSKGVAGLFGRILEGEQMTKFIRQMYYQGLLEKRSVTATGVGFIMRSVLADRWAAVKSHSQEIIGGLLYAMKTVKDFQTRASIEGCLQVIAEHDDSFCRIALNQPLPLHSSVADLWRSLGSNVNVAPVLLAHCIEVLRTTPVYSEVTEFSRCVSLPVLQSLCVLSELFQGGNTGLLLANVSDLAPILIVITAAVVGAKPPKHPLSAVDAAAGDAEWKSVHKLIPSKIAIDCLKELLKNTNSAVPISFEMIEDPNMYAEGLHVTSKCIFQSAELDCSRVIEALGPYLESDIEPQRAAAVAMYSAMLESKRPAEPELIEKVVVSLSNKSSDEALVVRIFCIRGIGSLSQFKSNIVDANAENSLRVILAGMEDSMSGPFNSAPVESMRALSKILPVMSKDLLQDDLVSFAMRLRPPFESDNAMVRALAFSLFGQVAALSDKENVRSAFVQEIHSVLVILLLHLNDEHQDVSSAIRGVFKLILPLLNSEALNNAFSYPEGISYSRHLRIICSALSSEYPEKMETYLNHVIGYFKSESPTMRANSCLLAGNLLAQPPTEDFRTNSSHIYPTILQLLADKDASVRYRAAESLSLMYH